MDQPLLFLIKLAWACRYRLPLLITVGFMALDIRMQLEIHVQMRRIRRGGPPLPLRGGRTVHDTAQNTEDRNNSDDSSNSWMTMEDDSDFEVGANPEQRGDGEDVPSTSVPVDSDESYLSFPEISNLLDVNVEN